MDGEAASTGQSHRHTLHTAPGALPDGCVRVCQQKYEINVKKEKNVFEGKKKGKISSCSQTKQTFFSFFPRLPFQATCGFTTSSFFDGLSF